MGHCVCVWVQLCVHYTHTHTHTLQSKYTLHCELHCVPKHLVHLRLCPTHIDLRTWNKPTKNIVQVHFQYFSNIKRKPFFYSHSTFFFNPKMELELYKRKNKTSMTWNKTRRKQWPNETNSANQKITETGIFLNTKKGIFITVKCVNGLVWVLLLAWSIVRLNSSSFSTWIMIWFFPIYSLWLLSFYP